MTVANLSSTITTSEFTEWIAFYFDEAEREAKAAKEAQRKR